MPGVCTQLFLERPDGPGRRTIIEAAEPVRAAKESVMTMIPRRRVLQLGSLGAGLGLGVPARAIGGSLAPCDRRRG